MICPGCYQTNFLLPLSRCYICNKITKQHRVCRACRSSSRLRRVWWLGSYESLLKQLITEMKYSRKRSHARSFGQYLAEALPYLPATTVVVHIPTASKRIRRRGFDQALILADSFGMARQLTQVSALRRINQIELIGKHRKERLAAMQAAFQVAKNVNLNGVSVLLIDDVLTTGASLEAAAALLRQAGARHVDAAVVARRLLT